jgi:hypothetical protein
MTSATVASQLEIRPLQNNKLKKEGRTTLSTLNYLDGVTSTDENVNYIILNYLLRTVPSSC